MCTKFGIAVEVVDAITSDNFWWSVEGCRFCRGSKITIFHWQNWQIQSPLRQGWRYTAQLSCDKFGNRIATGGGAYWAGPVVYWVVCPLLVLKWASTGAFSSTFLHPSWIFFRFILNTCRQWIQIHLQNCDNIAYFHKKSVVGFWESLQTPPKALPLDPTGITAPLAAHFKRPPAAYENNLILYVSCCAWFLMAALRSICGHYIFALWFLLFFFPRLISAVACRVDVYHTSTHIV